MPIICQELSWIQRLKKKKVTVCSEVYLTVWKDSVTVLNQYG